MIKNLDYFIYRIEKAILCVALSAMILFVFVDLVLREVAGTGVYQAQKLSLYLMIWVGFIGASVATKGRQHLKIDFLGQMLPQRPAEKLYAATSFITGLFALLLAKVGYDFVLQSYQYADPALAYVPEWLVQSAIPASLLVISFRSFINGLSVLRAEGSLLENYLQDKLKT